MDSTSILDLDALEHEAKGNPFRFMLGGKEYTMASPEEADWRAELNDVESMQMFMRDVLGDKQYAQFSAHRLPGWKLGRLFEEATKHYGLDSGEGPASPRSSNRTAKR